MAGHWKSVVLRWWSVLSVCVMHTGHAFGDWGMYNSLNVLFFFQVQTNLGDVQLHPVLHGVQTPLWGIAADAEATVHAETQTAQQQTPVPVSGQAAATHQTPASNVPTSVPIQVSIAPALAQAPVYATGPTFEPSLDSSSVMGKPHHSVPGLVLGPIPFTLPVPGKSAAPASAPASAPVAVSGSAPALQPAGIQTAVSLPECASLATTQQNLDTTFASSTFQQESGAEVWMKQTFAHFWVWY